MKKLLITSSILILILPFQLLGYESECPLLLFPSDLDLQEEDQMDSEEVCNLGISVYTGPSNNLDIVEKYIDTLKHFKNIEKLLVSVFSPNEKDSIYYTRILKELPNLENVEELGIIYSGPLPSELPDFPDVEEFRLINAYETERYGPFKSPDSYYFPGQDKKDSIAIVEYARSFSPPPFPYQLFNVIENVEEVTMRLNRSDTVLPDNLFKNIPKLRSLRIEENGLKKLPSSIGKLNHLFVLELRDCFLKSLFPEEWDSYPDSLLSLRLGEVKQLRINEKDNEWHKVFSEPCNNLEDFSLDSTKLPNLHQIDIALPNFEKLDKNLNALQPEYYWLNFHNMESLVSIGDNICIGERDSKLSAVRFFGASSLKDIINLKKCEFGRLQIHAFDTEKIWSQIQKVSEKGQIEILALDYGSIEGLKTQQFQPLKNLKKLRIDLVTIYGGEKTSIRDKEEIDENWLKEIREVLSDTEVIVK